MKKVGLTHRRETERAIIDALLKISEIVQKTETSRQHQTSTHTNKCSKKTVGDGDYNDFYDDNEQQRVPIPPPMRTLDSYLSGFNQQSLQIPSNCNQAPSPKWNSSENNKQDDRSSEKQFLDNNRQYSLKRRYYDNSSASSNEYRKKSSKFQSSHRSFRSDQNLQPIHNETEIQPAITTIHSQITTILDDQPSSLTIMPIVSAPTIPIEPQQCSPSSDKLTNSKTDFDLFIDQQLQATLEKHLLSSTKTSNERIQQQRKTRLTTLETGKLIDQLGFTKQVPNSEHYEKQRQLAMLAAKQGNYSLSYSIYTNLLHNYQYDCQLKSEILASRATTLLLEEKCFESIDDCTQAIAFNQWNKLAYVVRAACWMIKHEYFKAVEDYSKLFHFFDQSQHVLDLLNLAYEKFQLENQAIDNEQSIKDTQPPVMNNHPPSFSLASPTASFIQPAVYLCYPYQPYPITNLYEKNDLNRISRG